MFSSQPDIANPWKFFLEARESARAQNDPLTDLAYFATVNAYGQPSLRSLVLRHADDEGIRVFLNTLSPKWEDLQENPEYEILCYWPTLKQQFRVRGSWLLLPKEEILQGWQKQPHESKILDWYYQTHEQQSSPITFEDFTKGMNEVSSLYPDEVPMAPTASGLLLIPDSIEWLKIEGESRCHLRMKFERQADDGWESQLLVP